MFRLVNTCIRFKYIGDVLPTVYYSMRPCWLIGGVQGLLVCWGLSRIYLTVYGIAQGGGGGGGGRDLILGRRCTQH